MIKIKYNEPSIYTLGKLRLVPGENQVDPELFATVKDHPGFAHRVKNGAIVVSEPKKAENAELIKDPEPLKKADGKSKDKPE